MSQEMMSNIPEPIIRKRGGQPVGSSGRRGAKYGATDGKHQVRHNLMADIRAKEEWLAEERRRQDLGERSASLPPHMDMLRVMKQRAGLP